MKKKFKRFLVAAVSVIAVLIIVAVAINIYVVKSTEARILHCDEIKKTDCILILGAGLRPDGSPSSMLAERLECGLLLYQNGVSEKILVSGEKLAYIRGSTVGGYFYGSCGIFHV